ncbi:hypothetical protein FH972_007159 [Carpinus fangiana]|uniref:Uncharacterized protein n=1 Tax=Carpinus fangiana TaxID=176857 RepID=A0A5N6QWV7_9ROSI|nr:hypothetical protein FH972_007159 [Carpinus fangiana]
MALEERIGVEGHEELVGEGDEEAEDEQVELKVLEEMRGRRKRQGMERFCGVGLWGFQVVAGGADEVDKDEQKDDQRYHNYYNHPPTLSSNRIKQCYPQCV